MLQTLSKITQEELNMMNEWMYAESVCLGIELKAPYPIIRMCGYDGYRVFACCGSKYEWVNKINSERDHDDDDDEESMMYGWTGFEWEKKNDKARICEAWKKQKGARERVREHWGKLTKRNIKEWMLRVFWMQSKKFLSSLALDFDIARDLKNKT